MDHIKKGLSLEPDPEFTEKPVVAFGQSSNCKLNYSKKTNSRWIGTKMMSENRTEAPAWHTEPSVHNSCFSWHQRSARCRKKRVCFAIQPKELFPGKLSQSSFRNQCYTAATEAVTVERVVHSGCSGPGLCSEDEPEQSKCARPEKWPQAAWGNAIRFPLLLPLLTN